MSYTPVEIVNKALYKIGSEKINVLGENTKFGLIAKDIYPSIRDEVQEAHPWTFTIQWLNLQPVAGLTHPEFGGSAYQLPPDVLRPLEISGSPRWRWEGDHLFVDSSDCLAKCIVKEVNEGKFTATFVEAMACRLAMEFAYSSTNSASLKSAMQKDYETALAMARSFNSQSAGTPPRVPPPTDWARGRGLNWRGGRY